jgi:hypothetical protein
MGENVFSRTSLEAFLVGGTLCEHAQQTAQMQLKSEFLFQTQ